MVYFTKGVHIDTLLIKMKGLSMTHKVYFDIKSLCDEHQITLSELAKQSNINVSILNKMANNKRNSIYFEHLERIGNTLGIEDINKIIHFEKSK